MSLRLVSSQESAGAINLVFLCSIFSRLFAGLMSGVLFFSTCEE